MESTKNCIQKIQQLTATMRQLQAELLVMKEYISRYMVEQNQNDADDIKFSFEGENASYKISPDQMLNLLESYKI